jgi:hypothetical protein
MLFYIKIASVSHVDDIRFSYLRWNMPKERERSSEVFMSNNIVSQPTQHW